MSVTKDMLMYGTHAARPAASAGNDGKFYRETDTGSTFQSNGASWVLVGSGSAAGDVVGPGSATDGHLAVFDGTTGKLIKDGGVPSSGGGGDFLVMQVFS